MNQFHTHFKLHSKYDKHGFIRGIQNIKWKNYAILLVGTGAFAFHVPNKDEIMQCHLLVDHLRIIDRDREPNISGFTAQLVSGCSPLTKEKLKRH